MSLRLLRAAAAAAAGAATVAALGYGAFALARVGVFARRARESAADASPSVSILNPLYGDDPELEANLRSFVEQDYPQHQVVFGVHDEGDAALPVARRVAAAYPDRAVDVSVGGAPDVANPKIANLISMLRLARGDVVVIADSDMRVDPAYVRTVTAPLADARVGVVTALYAGIPAAGLASALGAMFITEQFAPSVLVALALEPLRYCFGATMALRRSVLQAVGGLETLGPHLADDHVLGQLVSELGFEVVLSRYVVRNVVAEPGLAALWRHELRWHRTIRSVRPLGYAFMFLTYPLPLAVAFLVLARRRALPFAAVVLAAALRAALQRAASAALGVPPAAPWLIPLRDAFGLAVWACAARGRSVRWREQELTLGSNDLLRR
jgi:ceramide glucosyltransferase